MYSIYYLYGPCSGTHIINYWGVANETKASIPSDAYVVLLITKMSGCK